MADNATTLFDLPTSPDQFGVVLAPSNLRKIDFSALDYETSRRAILEYIQTYFPDDFNDFVASNGIMMIMEIISSSVGKLSLRNDILGQEATLPTAKTERAVVNHLALINQRIKRQTPASVDIEITVDQPVLTDILIQAGTSFSLVGADNAQIVYEIYRAPGDWTGSIILPANKRGVIAYGLEGVFVEPVTFTSPGGTQQEYSIQDNNILESPLVVMVIFGSVVETWRVITEPIERYGPNDKVVEVNFFNNQAVFRFGDNVTGQAPASGSVISISYRVGGGRRGRIGIGQIDSTQQLTPLPPANAAILVRFRNISPSVGGSDKETLEQAKRRAPRDFSLQRSIVTDNDYAQAASSFSHPVFGSVSKSVATIRTSLNANLVEIYALAEGADGRPVLPSIGLKTGLATYFRDLNVLTDHLVVVDGALHPVDIEMVVVVNRNADASVVKEKVESAIGTFFDLSRWEMGYAFYISSFVETIKSIDGIAYVNLYEPANNVLPTGKVAGEAPEGVGFNELIVEGQRRTSYYYDTNPPTGGVKLPRI